MTKANLFKVGQNLKVTDCILANLHFLLSIIRLHSMMKKEK